MRSHSPLLRSLTAIAAVILTTGLLATACTSTPPADNTSQPTTQATPSTGESTTETNPETTEPATAADVLADAVDSLVEAGTYAFEAAISLSLQGEPVAVELEGWVDGSDRELVMKIDAQSVTTRVIDGVATVEREGETVEVPLEEAGAAPSIVILKSIQNPIFETATKITGKLNASDLAAAEYDVTGSAAIAVTITSDGNLVGYSIRADDDSWTVEVDFTDIGEDPTR